MSQRQNVIVFMEDNDAIMSLNITHSLNQSFNQSVSQSVRQSENQSINQAIKQSINQSIILLPDASISGFYLVFFVQTG